MKEINSIENYIIYLIEECGLSISLHPIEEETLITFSKLRRFIVHDNSYCTHIKSSKDGFSQCLRQQKAVLHRLKKDSSTFCGVCHAGVMEYVYPLRAFERIIGFISVSGYSCEKGKACVNTASEQFGYSLDVLERAYAYLPSVAPSKEKIDTLILPLCYMLELAYIKEERPIQSDSLLTQILRYVQKNYSLDLTVSDVCNKFACSRSFLSHKFKKETGRSFREYLTDIRLENAKRLLEHSNMNVTEISFSVGFDDSNYFSNVFKKAVGVSPITYRKNYRNQK